MRVIPKPIDVRVAVLLTGKAREDLNYALGVAHDINRTMYYNLRLRDDVEREWKRLRDDLNSLAAIYNLPRVERLQEADPKRCAGNLYQTQGG